MALPTFSGDPLDPKWDQVGWVHDWRNYINDGLRAIWDTFTDEQKLAIAKNADAIAGNEEWD